MLIKFYFFFIFFLVSISTLLAVFGIFNAFFVLLVSLIISAFCSRIVFEDIVFPKLKLLDLIIVFSFAFFYCIMFTNWLPFTRDPAGYMMSAVNISRYKSVVNQDIGSAPLHSFNQYNLRSGSYTSQFFPAFSSYLAILYSFVGIVGLTNANFLLFIGFLLAVYTISDVLFIRNNNSKSLLLLLLGTNYLITWFTKGLYSENLLSSIFWMSCSFLFLSIKKYNSTYNLASILFSLLLPIIRIEGLIGSIFLLLINTGLILKRNNLEKFKLLVVLFLAQIPLLASVKYFSSVNSGYLLGHYVNVSGAFFKRFGINFSLPKESFFYFIIILFFILVVCYRLIKTISKAKFSLLLTFSFTVFFVMSILFKNNFSQTIIAVSKYNFLILGLWAFIYLLATKKQQIDNTLYVYLLLILFFHSVFFITPAIANDHPWFMRRFFPIIMPSFLLIFLFVVNSLKNEKIRKTIFVLTLLLNILHIIPIIFFQENRGMESFQNDLINTVGTTSLIIAEPGWQWQQFLQITRSAYGVESLPKIDGINQEQLQTLSAHKNKIYYLSDKSVSRNDTRDNPIILNNEYSCIGNTFELSDTPPMLTKICKKELFLFEVSDKQNFINSFYE